MLKIGVRVFPYIIAFAAIISVSGLCLLASSIIDYRAVGMYLLFTIFLLAFYIRRGPVLVAAALSAILWNYLFIPPLYTFHIYTFTDLLMVIMYFIIALIGGSFTARLRSREMADRVRERQATSLYGLVKDIIHAESAEDIWRTSVRHFAELFNARIACFPVDEHCAMAHLPLLLSTFIP
jgi:two-component system sensor histidine kinase KdpD